jgi:trehalose 6-phosphate synthase
MATEYVASQPTEDPGVLMSSCFARAAQELGEAVLVNPHDVEGMAEGIRQGLTMSLGERKERWTVATIERNDITHRRESFVAALSASGAN